MTKITLMAGVAALSLAPLLALPAQADTSAEISIAATHAGMAVNQGKIKGVHTHLQHVLNCLVGPKGEGFDSSAIDPCNKAGDGAIPDATDAATKTNLEKAETEVKAGLASNDLAKAKAEAKAAKSTLTAAR